MTTEQTFVIPNESSQNLQILANYDNLKTLCVKNNNHRQKKDCYDSIFFGKVETLFLHGKLQLSSSVNFLKEVHLRDVLFPTDFSGFENLKKLTIVSNTCFDKNDWTSILSTLPFALTELHFFVTNMLADENLMSKNIVIKKFPPNIQKLDINFLAGSLLLSQIPYSMQHLEIGCVCVVFDYKQTSLPNLNYCFIRTS